MMGWQSSQAVREKKNVFRWEKKYIRRNKTLDTNFPPFFFVCILYGAGNINGREEAELRRGNEFVIKSCGGAARILADRTMKGKNVWPCAINFVPYPPHFCVTLFEWGVFHVQRTLEGSSRTHVDITCNKAPVVMITKPSDPIRVGTCEPRSTAAQLYN